MTAGAVQLLASSQLAAFSVPPGRVSQYEMTSLTPPSGAGSSHVTYRRPKVGLVAVLSMVICGLSWMTSLELLHLPPASSSGSATLGFVPKSVAPAAIRLTKMWLRVLMVVQTDRPPAQMLPLGSAARIGSPLGLSVSGVEEPLMSNSTGKLGCEKLVPPSSVIARPPSPVPLMSLPNVAKRWMLAGSTAMNVSDSSVMSLDESTGLRPSGPNGPDGPPSSSPSRRWVYSRKTAVPSSCSPRR